MDHPLVAATLTQLRDRRTPTPSFRRHTDTLVSLLAVAATAELPVVSTMVDTPLARAAGVQVSGVPLIVPILRAGLGMLDGMLRAVPDAEVGVVGLARDESTAVASWYADRLPASTADRYVAVLDPMLATGGTLSAVVAAVLSRGASRVTCVCLLAAPEGVAAMDTAFPHADVHLVTAAVDERLDERAYIVPGLGDAGDRLFGSVPPLPG